MNAIFKTPKVEISDVTFPVNVINTQICTHEKDIEANRQLIEKPYALILQGTISWTIPLVFMDIIQARTDKWLPTFIIGSWYHIPNGTAWETYENHVEAEKVWAITLRKLNFSQIEQLAVFITEKVNEGQRWQDLTDEIIAFNDAHPDIISTIEASALRSWESLNM